MYDRKLSMTIQLSDSDEYEGGDFEFDNDILANPPDKNILREKNSSVKLTIKEAKVLLYLYKYLGNDVKREKLASDINVSIRTIDVLVKRIREKISSLPNSKNFLLTSRGIGYKLEP